jgi:selenide,water dikinase
VVHPFLGPGGAPRSLVLTIDVVTPIVDEPRVFGVIAATNALSDVYAMGGRPEVALSFAGFPSDKLSLSVLAEILGGMQEACARARCAIVGGHTISDAEPKAGLAVVGSVDPLRVWSQRSAKAGQLLVLTKALGTGVVGQAIRAGKASDALVAAAVEQMVQLNDRAAEVGLAVGATSCTDVTGFGLLGHLRNLVEASALSAELWADAVPFLEGTRALVTEGLVPGGSKRNLAHASQVTRFDDAVSDETRLLLADAQTSGGLLLCVPEAEGEAALRLLGEAGIARAAVIGQLSASTSEARIVVRDRAL